MIKDLTLWNKLEIFCWFLFKPYLFKAFIKKYLSLGPSRIEEAYYWTYITKQHIKSQHSYQARHHLLSLIIPKKKEELS